MCTLLDGRASRAMNTTPIKTESVRCLYDLFRSLFCWHARAHGFDLSLPHASTSRMIVPYSVLMSTTHRMQSPD
jgi:hypothetical protein